MQSRNSYALGRNTPSTCEAGDAPRLPPVVETLEVTGGREKAAQGLLFQRVARAGVVHSVRLCLVRGYGGVSVLADLIFEQL